MEPNTATNDPYAGFPDSFAKFARHHEKQLTNQLNQAAQRLPVYRVELDRCVTEYRQVALALLTTLTHKRTTLEPAEIARYASDRFARECDVLMENAKSRAEYAQRYSDSAFAQWARKQEANLSFTTTSVYGMENTEEKKTDVQA